jgi:2-polyprenyl-3-methyl-5-hydroxy-6-metoxy-1,4-benzoquinol methylase
VTYKPQEFWDQRLSEHFDLRGTGETGLPLAYNRACYALRRETLDRALKDASFDPRGKRVLDVGPGSGFWVEYYLGRGAQVTGVDIAPTAVKRLAAKYTEATFIHSDVSEIALTARYDVVNAFDVLYHITDEAKWEVAVRHLAEAVAPGGLLLITDVFSTLPRVAEHNVMRPLSRYEAIIAAAGLQRESLRPTHHLLNAELGAFRFLNRAPGLLLMIDRVMIATGAGNDDRHNRLLLSRRN